MKAWSRSLRILTVVSAVLVLGSCTEKLDSSGVCAVLCPPLGGAVQNVTLDAIAFDTTVAALSGPGAEPGLVLASRGDTLDARVILRYDSLPAIYHVGTDSFPITLIDSATLRFRLDTLRIKGTGPLTIEAYDVDTDANDTSTTAVLALFTPDRFVGSQMYTRADLKDTLDYVLPGAHILAKAQSGERLRLGLRVVSASSTQLLLSSEEGGAAPRLRFRVSADTSVAPFTLFPFSQTPADDPVARSNLGDYTVFARRPPEGGPTELDVGGIPVRRTYFRFDIPPGIRDSSTIIRATLLLNQVPNPLLDPTDTLFVLPQLVLAGAAVTDPAKAAQITTALGIDTLKVRPGDTGPILVELGPAFQVWRAVKPAETPHAIVLRSSSEGTSPLQVRFSSLEAAPALRPRLRISFTEEVPLGLP
ncbi:MAG TPA: hypothetical protein VFS56_03070 [Gemmatimonadaceae bacterium]|nr:hypothetical protein [Gemmatimonadaceae bacterium]